MEEDRYGGGQAWRRTSEEEDRREGGQAGRGVGGEEGRRGELCVCLCANVNAHVRMMCMCELVHTYARAVRQALVSVLFVCLLVVFDCFLLISLLVCLSVVLSSCT